MTAREVIGDILERLQVARELGFDPEGVILEGLIIRGFVEAEQSMKARCVDLIRNAEARELGCWSYDLGFVIDSEQLVRAIEKL